MCREASWCCYHSLSIIALWQECLSMQTSERLISCLLFVHLSCAQRERSSSEVAHTWNRKGASSISAKHACVVQSPWCLGPRFEWRGWWCICGHLYLWLKMQGPPLSSAYAAPSRSCEAEVVFYGRQRKEHQVETDAYPQMQPLGL